MKLAAILTLLALPAAAEVPQVMTDIPPVHSLVAQVMGDLGTPGMFLERGGDEHDLALRPSQMRDLGAADLVIWVGPQLTPGLDSAIASAGTSSLTLLNTPATRPMDYPSGGVNPHAWLDPDNAAAWVWLIADRLGTLDPEHADTYRANATSAVQRLQALRADLSATLAPIAAKPWIGWHDAYGYFARAFDLTYLGGVAEGDEAPPGAARLSELKALGEGGGIACVFPEAGHDPALLAALGPVTAGAPLDPVGAGQDPGPGAYDVILRALAQELMDCLAPL